MNNLMLDLETMGNNPNAAIVAIGAVKFDPNTGELGDTFYRRIDLISSVQLGGVMDADTVLWWLDQDCPARQEIINKDGLATQLAAALDDFSLYATGDDPKNARNIKLWGNGSDFDNVILASAYRRVSWTKEEIPWQFYNNRCYRTMKNLFPDIKIERRGIHHNALDDAIHQAEHLCRIFRHINQP